MVQQSHQRTAAHQKEEDKGVKVDTGVPIHQLKPPMDDAMAMLEDKGNERYWEKMGTPPREKKQKPGRDTPRSRAFPPPRPRQYNKPEAVIPRMAFWSIHLNTTRSALTQLTRVRTQTYP
jgi:hypothetical protein